LKITPKRRAPYCTHKGRFTFCIDASCFPKIESDFWADTVGFAAPHASFVVDPQNTTYHFASLETFKKALPAVSHVPPVA